MAKIFRIEHKKTRKGLYHYLELADRLSCPYDKSPTRPLPPEDGLSEIYPWTSDVRFGFTTIEQLLAWFDNNKADLDIMDQFGLVVGVYESDQIEQGFHQAVFPAANHTPDKRVAELSLTSL